MQDTLLGCSKFTRRDTFLSRDLAFNVLLNFEGWDGVVPPPAILKPEPVWTGKQLVSLFLPLVNFTRTSNGHKDADDPVMSAGDTSVLVQKGELLRCGVMRV